MYLCSKVEGEGGNKGINSAGTCVAAEQSMLCNTKTNLTMKWDVQVYGTKENLKICYPYCKDLLYLTQ